MLIAVVDANVLFPMILRDTLLRAAAAGCFRLHWSSRILDEVMRNLIEEYGMAEDKATALRRLMEEAFPDAAVDGWETLEPEMRNHPEDRYVAAAAASIGAAVVVTSNIRDFAQLPAGIVAKTPDAFLSELVAARPAELMAALAVQAATFRRPPLSVLELIQRLATVAPVFAAQASALLTAMNDTRKPACSDAPSGEPAQIAPPFHHTIFGARHGLGAWCQNVAMHVE